MGVEVSVVPCGEYTFDVCRQALQAVLEPLGGLDWVKPGMKIAIKVNLISGMKPEAAGTTNPVLVSALAEMLCERGAAVTVGDSPGGLFSAGYVGRMYTAAGLYAVEEHGAMLNQDFTQRIVSNPEGMVCRRFPFTAWLDKADAVIDFCKLKTHGMMAFTGAAKNLFGVIPGTNKPEFHFQFSNPANFARMLLDVDTFVNPRLSICDAVVAMEGNGPTAGTPRPMGFLAASESPHKLDLLCAATIGLKRTDVPTLVAAYERELIPSTADDLEVAGEWKKYITPDFKRIEAQSSLLFRGHAGLWGNIWGTIIQKAICPRPRVHPDVCIGCGKCRDVCPAKAIEMVDHRPKIDRAKCIHCFCCQEFCLKGAMEQHRTALARILNPQK